MSQVRLWFKPRQGQIRPALEPNVSRTDDFYQQLPQMKIK